METYERKNEKKKKIEKNVKIKKTEIDDSN